MKTWCIPPGEAFVVRNRYGDGARPHRLAVELPAPLEVPEAAVELVQRQIPNWFLSFKHGGDQLEVNVNRCFCVELNTDRDIVVDVEYGSWPPTTLTT